MMQRRFLFKKNCLALAGAAAWALVASHLAAAADAPYWDGIYQAIPDGKVLKGGLKNSGSPAAAALLPLPATTQATHLSDPFKLCQPIGAFRMMAQPRVKIEWVGQPDRVVLLFEDLSHGYLRSLYFADRHPSDVKPQYAFQGNSIAHWEGNTLVVDTIGFNERTWINDERPASEQLHLLERIRPVLDGTYLEYKITASDPSRLAKPYSYVRYFEKTDAAVQQDVCEIDSDWTPDVG